MVLKRMSLDICERVFYPVIPIIVTASKGTRIGGLAAAWWSYLSFKPPLIGVSIAPERFTYRLIKSTGVYGLNLLDFKDIDKMPYIGDVSERFYRDKLRRGGIKVFYGDKLGVPLIEEAVAAAEVKLVKTVDVGDHDWFIGEIVSIYVSQGFDGYMWRLENYNPIMYLGRTRRPGKVYRVYLSPKDYEWRRIEFAPGELAEAARIRHMVRDEVFRLLAGSRGHKVSELKEVLKPLIDKYGLDEEDIEIYIEEAKRNNVI